LGESADYSLVAIEVNEGDYTGALDKFVLECLREGLPIKLFVAVPVTASPTQVISLVRQAKENGIGVVEVDGAKIRFLVHAVSLSLIGLRLIDPKRFPKSCHARLMQAEDTFLNGDPAKACGRIYDLIELWTRSVAVEIDRLNLWRTLPPSIKRPRINLKKGPWAKVIELVNDYADFPNLSKNNMRIDKALWGRIRGLIPHRNDTGHEPATRDEVQERDQQLRTRFEHAVDTFAALAKASPKISA
jgi:hypothetical protein